MTMLHSFSMFLCMHFTIIYVLLVDVHFPSKFLRLDECCMDLKFSPMWFQWEARSALAFATFSVLREQLWPDHIKIYLEQELCVASNSCWWTVQTKLTTASPYPACWRGLNLHWSDIGRWRVVGQQTNVTEAAQDERAKNIFNALRLRCQAGSTFRRLYHT